MYVGNLGARAVLIHDDRAIDIATASGGRFGPAPRAVLESWAAFEQWSQTARIAYAEEGQEFDPATLLAPVPDPRQVFAIGLNYRAHAEESGFAVPEHPPVFTKFLGSLSGPITEVALPAGGSTDWEVELVVVIGHECFQVAEENAWDAVAGLMVGQDLSERRLQQAGPAPQFSLGKSYPGFGPTGPWYVSARGLAERDDLGIACSLNGEIVQSGRTSDMLFKVPELIARLSRVVQLFPGDLIFTGTPSGVGIGRTPQRFLQPGDVLESWIHGIGRLHQRFVG